MRPVEEAKRLLFAVVPVHLHGNEVDDAARTNNGASNARLAFVRFTIANLAIRNNANPYPTYWLHFCLAYVFVIYALWLVWKHYQVRPRRRLPRRRRRRPVPRRVRMGVSACAGAARAHNVC